MNFRFIDNGQLWPSHTILPTTPLSFSGYPTQILSHHFRDELLKARLMCPAKPLMRLACIPHKDLHLGGAEVAGIDLD